MSNLARVDAAPLAVGAFSHASYSATRPFRWFGLGELSVFSPDGALVIYAPRPHSLRGEWSMFADLASASPRLHFIAREREHKPGDVLVSDLFKPEDPALTWNFNCDVFDAQTREPLGVIRATRKRPFGGGHDGGGPTNDWEILDPSERPIGRLKKVGLGVLRSLVGFLPQYRWHVEIDGVRVAEVNEFFRFLGQAYDLDVSKAQGKMDSRFALACAVFLLVAETSFLGAGRRV